MFIITQGKSAPHCGPKVCVWLCAVFLLAAADRLPAQSQPFPALYFTDTVKTQNAQAAARLFWAASETELVEPEPLPRAVALPAAKPESILDSDILAYYGHPLSKNMGILGRFTKEETDLQLQMLADEYRAVNGGREVITAFYIIYGTVWPAGDIGILRESVLLEYIQYAQEHNMLVFIDHQIGRYDPVDALKRMLPYLAYPNVHLALDPEWRTTRPMEEIGSVTGAELNRIQQVMEEYIVEHHIQGERMLVIHQFNYIMIKNRFDVRTDFEHVRLIHCADGWGTAAQKLGAYAYNAQAANMPFKGFKLFLPSATTNNVDTPLFTPKQVIELNPRPYLIMYQ
jgi:hypothetical protein